MNMKESWMNCDCVLLLLRAVNSTRFMLSSISSLLCPIVRQDWEISRNTELFWTWTGLNESAVIGNSSVWKRHNTIRCLWDAAFVWMPLFSNAFNKCSAMWRAQKPLFFWFSAIWIFPTIFTSIKRFKASAAIYMFCCCVEFKLISWSVQKESL